MRTEFNQRRDKGDLFIWLLPLTASPQFTNNNSTENYQKAWNCSVVFLHKDTTDSVETEYADIWDVTDNLADKFVNRLNDWSMKATDTVGAVTLQGFQQTPFLKDDADIYSGWVLTFQMVVSDDFEYCTPENISLYADS
jgi:hypothetical protein